MKGITLLGSTGSIGISTLDVIGRHPDRFRIVALTAHSNMERLYEQCVCYRPQYAVISSQALAVSLQERLKSVCPGTRVMYGAKAMADVAALPEVETVVAAIVGAAGLRPTLAAAKAGKRILLANKETLVTAGQVFMQTAEAHQAQIIPVDSEHSAIFQCLSQSSNHRRLDPSVLKITLTASGGPFLYRDKAEFKRISVTEACAHPNWSMGQKISIDSATMMNKGLEVIEAYWLFGCELEQLDVVIHPESIIHSMVAFKDGSTLAQCGYPDMRTPIAYALAWPQRIESGVAPLNLVDLNKLTFLPVDYEKFSCLSLAFESLKAGGTAPTILNAANEEAVQAFVDNKIKFSDIPTIIEDVLNKVEVHPAETLEQIEQADVLAREQTKRSIQTDPEVISI